MMQTDKENPIHLAQQRYKLTAWIRGRLWAQVLIGMVSASWSASC
jgi:hypothetical protein